MPNDVIRNRSVNTDGARDDQGDVRREEVFFRLSFGLALLARTGPMSFCRLPASLLSDEE